MWQQRTRAWEKEDNNEAETWSVSSILHSTTQATRRRYSNSVWQNIQGKQQREEQIIMLYIAREWKGEKPIKQKI